jgi:hypothetical protein
MPDDTEDGPDLEDRLDVYRQDMQLDEIANREYPPAMDTVIEILSRPHFRFLTLPPKLKDAYHAVWFRPSTRRASRTHHYCRLIEEKGRTPEDVRQMLEPKGYNEMTVRMIHDDSEDNEEPYLYDLKIYVKEKLRKVVLFRDEEYFYVYSEEYSPCLELSKRKFQLWKEAQNYAVDQYRLDKALQIVGFRPRLIQVEDMSDHDEHKIMLYSKGHGMGEDLTVFIDPHPYTGKRGIHLMKVPENMFDEWADGLSKIENSFHGPENRRYFLREERNSKIGPACGGLAIGYIVALSSGIFVGAPFALVGAVYLGILGHKQAQLFRTRDTEPPEHLRILGDKRAVVLNAIHEHLYLPSGARPKMLTEGE